MEEGPTPQTVDDTKGKFFFVQQQKELHMMEIKPIYHNTELLFIGILSALFLAGPSTIAMLIARKKGYHFVTLGYFIYAFTGTPVVYLTIYYATSGALRYFLAALILPLYLLAPIWHARRLSLSKKLQALSDEQGKDFQSCYRCYESFDAESTICPTCKRRTPLSLIANRYIVLFALSILTFVFAFFMASDEYYHDPNTYNMLSVFFNVASLLPYLAVSKSSEFTVMFFVQLALVMGCAFYTVGVILYTARCLTRGQSVVNPAFLFIVAVYITVGHPILFWPIKIGRNVPSGVDLSLGWAFWVMAYLLLWVSLYSLYTEDKHKDDPPVTAFKVQ